MVQWIRRLNVKRGKDDNPHRMPAELASLRGCIRLNNARKMGKKVSLAGLPTQTPSTRPDCYTHRQRMQLGRYGRPAGHPIEELVDPVPFGPIWSSEEAGGRKAGMVPCRPRPVHCHPLDRSLDRSIDRSSFTSIFVAHEPSCPHRRPAQSTRIGPIGVPVNRDGFRCAHIHCAPRPPAGRRVGHISPSCRGCL